MGIRVSSNDKWEIVSIAIVYRINQGLGDTGEVNIPVGWNYNDLFKIRIKGGKFPGANRGILVTKLG